MEQPNLSYINDLSGGDESFKEKLINIIRMEFPNEREIYFKNIESKKFKEDLQHWYNGDKGQNIINDIIEILSQLEPICQ